MMMQLLVAVMLRLVQFAGQTFIHMILIYDLINEWVDFLLAEKSYLIINLISIFFNPFHFVVQADDGDLHCLYIFV